MAAFPAELAMRRQMLESRVRYDYAMCDISAPDLGPSGIPPAANPNNNLDSLKYRYGIQRTAICWLLETGFLSEDRHPGLLFNPGCRFILSGKM
jgi:hypothetical protein